MRLAHHRPRFVPGRERHERGAVLVEFATVAMFLVVMLGGAFDFGMAWKSGLGVTEAARAGARVGSSSGKNAQADRDLLLSVRAALASSGMLEEVQRVVVFNATSTNTVPTACKTGTGTSTACDALTGQQLRDLTSGSALDGNGCISSSARKGWCPTTRNNLQISANYLGVWVQVAYEYEFGLLGSTKMIERTAIMRIEPI